MADKKQTWGSRHGDLSNEGLSLLENAAYLGQPIPDKLREILAQLHERSKKEAEPTDKGEGDQDLHKYISLILF